jgi:sigma-B regulation protein RsbU (phosphoserine phosphatase)
MASEPDYQPGVATSSALPGAPEDEARRLAAVRRYDTLVTPPDGAFDRVAALAARIFAAPMAAVTIVDTDRIWFKASYGLQGLTETGRDPGLCDSAIAMDGPHVVADAGQDLRAVGNVLVYGELGVRFYAAAPLTTADGYRLGTINVLDTVARRVTPEQLAMLEDLAAIVMDELELRLSSMAAVRLERQLHETSERERARVQAIATTLQRTLLPPELPRVPGLHAAAYYYIAVPEDVGGDFYDLFPVGAGRYAFFLGDVCGKGVPAAGLTSLARYTLRASAAHHVDPVLALRDLNAAILLEQDEREFRYCTVIYGDLEPTPPGVRVRLAHGGHPLALLLRADGTVTEAGRPGTIVGGFPEPYFTATTDIVDLAPGDGLLLYTDGLTEARTGPTDRYGDERLAEFLAAAAGQPAPQLISRLQQLLDGFDPAPDDDVALLAFTVPR